MGWSAILKGLGKWGLKGSKAAVESAGSAIIHPSRTLKGLGTATKGAAVGGAAAYVGWEKITTDKSVARIVGDAVVGESTIDGITDKVEGVSNSISELKDSVGGAVNTVNDAVASADSKWNGMSNFLRGVFSGNGGNMMGNFFSNIGNGNVSGLSLVGLVVSALLIFGRFGWLGKIAGAVLGMMMIGNNINMGQVMGGQKAKQTPQPQLADIPPAKMPTLPKPPLGDIPPAKKPTLVPDEPDIDRGIIHRSR